MRGARFQGTTVACQRPLLVAMTSKPTFALTLSNEGGLTIEKQIKNTSVWGYDSGRSRS